jgi:hypothetical protein
MSEFLAFLHLGFRHIVDPEAFDHLLFLLALAAIYRFKDWRESLWVITAFTVGHSITLALAVTGALMFPIKWIEFLIPVTIVLTAGANLLTYLRQETAQPSRWRAVFAGTFGLVHGAGFAEYLQRLFMDHIAVPLVGFNLGIEAGQLLVLSVAAMGLSLLDAGLHRTVSSSAWPALRVRILSVSALVLVLGSRMAADRVPW